MAFTYGAVSISTVGFSGTTATVALPTGAVEGMLAVLGVMHRETLSAIPSWTLVDVATFDSGAGLAQYEALYYKVLDAADITAGSVSATQAASARLELVLNTFSFTGTLAVGGSWVSTGEVGYTQAVPTYNAVLGVNVTGWTNSSSIVTCTYSTDWIQASGSASPASRRQASAYRIMDASVDREITATLNLAPPNGIGGVTVYFYEAVAGAPQVSQETALVLVDVGGPSKVAQLTAQVLWGVSSLPQVSQAPVLVLGRPIPRRVIGITD